MLPTLSAETIEAISKVLDELTNSEITHELQKVGIVDHSPGITKWKRLHDAFANYQNISHCSNSILKFCINYFKPQRFINKDPNLFEEQRKKFNQAIGFKGWEIADDGSLKHYAGTKTIDEALERSNYFVAELKKRMTHQQVFKYCTPEILAQDYFHVVEEAVKGLFERIREISCCYTDDGSSLIDKVMGEKNPCVHINNFSTKSELSEHKGFSSLLKSLYSLFRNPGAHSPREIWQLDKTDALDILGIVSLCHRKLDNAYRVKLP